MFDWYGIVTLVPAVFPRVAIIFAVAASLAFAALIGSMNDNAASGVISSITITEDSRITGGHGPTQIAVNSATHMVYVTNPGEQAVTVIRQEGARDSLNDSNSSLLRVVDTIEVPSAFGIAANPITNTIYVSGYTGSSVYVVDGSVNRVTSTITVGSAPRGVAVDPSSNTAYVANFASDSISVIDGSTNQVTDTIDLREGALEEGPRGVAIDPEAGVLYVANWLSDSVSIIDTSTNMVVGKVLDVGSNPSAIAINERTGKVYVASRDSVSVISASNNSYELVGNLPVGAPEMDDAEFLLGGIAVNQETNLIYFTNRMSNSTTVIDGNEDRIVDEIASTASQIPRGVAIDESLDAVYIASQGSDSLTLIDGSTHQIKISIQIGGRPSSIAVNPETNRVYVGNYKAGSVSILNDTVGNNLIDVISFGQNVMDIEVNDKTNKVYVLISTVEPDGFPRGTIVVIDGNTSRIVDRIGIAALAPSSIAINTITNMLYIGHDGYNHHTITVIDGSTNEVASSINTGYNYSEYIAVNEKANKLYVVVREPSTVLMYDGAKNGIGAIEDSEPVKIEIPASGRPAGIAVNPETDMVYVTDYWDGTVAIIDGSEARVVKTLANFASPTGVAVDVKTNTVYVTDNDFNTVVVIDGSSNKIVAELITDKGPLGVATNQESSAVYVTNTESGNVLMYEELQINASKFRTVPFSLTAKVMRTGPSAVMDGDASNNTASGSQVGYVAGPEISGRAQDVKVTDIIIKPQENMLAINYTRADEGDKSRRDVRGGIIEVTLPTSVVSDIYQFRLERISQYLQVDAKSVDDVANGFFIHEGNHYPKTPSPTFTYTSSNATSNTIKFIVPLDGEDSIGIYGAKVMPEFGSSWIIATDGEWKIAYTVGQFLYSDLPKPDQIFKAYYRVINGTMEKIAVGQTKVSSSGNGTLEIKFPRNYPYTNEEVTTESIVPRPLVFFDDEPYDKMIEITYNDITDCFFVFSIPFTGNQSIGLAWPYLATNLPYHGDEIPENCIPQTLVEDVPTRKDGTIAPHQQFKAGVAAEDAVCPPTKQGETRSMLLISPEGKPYCVKITHEGFMKRHGWTEPYSR